MRHYTGVALMLAWIGFIAPEVVQAQDDPPSATASLEAFAANTADPEVDYPSDVYPDARGVMVTLAEPANYSAARVDSILDGLRNLAHDATSERTRIRSVITLVLAGDVRYNRELPGVVARMSQIYEGATSPSDEAIRGFVLRAMPHQAEVDAARSFLESVAVDGTFFDAAGALHGLRQMGPLGEDTLRRLHANGSVGSQAAREVLRRMVEDEPPA